MIQNIIWIISWGVQGGMVLIKNVTTTINGDWYLKAQHYTVLTNVVYKTIRACLLQLHNKLLSSQSTFQEINSYPFLCIICFFKFTHKTSNIT